MWGPVDAPIHILDELQARGVIKASTDLSALCADMDADPVSFYVGFAPTGDSCHVGQLMAVLASV